MTYSTIEWACDQIRNYQAAHNCSPDSLLLTEGQAWALAGSMVHLNNRRTKPLSELVQSIRNGEAYLLGVPLKLFEVPHGQVQ